MHAEVAMKARLQALRNEVTEIDQIIGRLATATKAETDLNYSYRARRAQLQQIIDRIEADVMHECAGCRAPLLVDVQTRLQPLLCSPCRQIRAL